MSLPTTLPTTLAGLPPASALQQIFLFVAGGACLNMLVRSCVPHGWRSATRNTARDGEGAEFYTYVLCCVTQIFVFPTLYLLSVSQYPDLRSHCASSWAECATAAGSADGGACWMRVLAMSMIAYLAKDLPYCNTLEVLHHVAGIFVTLGFMCTERGMHGYLTGCVTLEFANFFMNIAHIWPYEDASRLFMHRLNVLGMTASHVLGMYVTYFTVVNRGENDSAAFFVAFAVASLAVMYVRQQLNYGNYCIVRDSQKKMQ